MKKFLVVVLAFAVVIGLVAAMGCSKSATGPTDAQKTQTAVANVNATATASAVAANAAVEAANLYNFTTDQTGDWTATHALSTITWDTTAGAGHYGITGCMSVAYAGTGTQVNASGEITHQIPWGTNNPGNFGEVDLHGKTLTAWVYVPTAAVNNYAIQWNVQQDGVWGNYQKWDTLTTSGWTEVTFPIVTADCAATGQDETKINQIQMQLLKTADGSPDVSQNILFDSISGW